MHLNNPDALWLLTLFGVLLLLLRFRATLPRRTASNWHLWQEARPEDEARRAPARLKVNWTLALQASFMLAVISAAARPVLVSPSRQVTLVFDLSASMGATFGTATRLDAARAKARAIVSSLEHGARVRIIAAGIAPVDDGDFRAGDTALRYAIDRLRATAGDSAIEPAVELARVSGAPEHDIFVFSDGSQPSDLRGVHWISLGAPADNLAITALAARRLPQQPTNGQVLVEVSNYGSSPSHAEVEVSQEGRAAIRASVSTRARAAETVTFTLHDMTGVITARLVGNRDALAIDDRRVIVVPPPSPVRVQLVSTGNFFLEKVLSTNPAWIVHVATHVETRPAPDVIVCDRCGNLPDGDAGVLMFAPLTATAPAPAPLTVSLRSHPVAASINPLGLVGMPLRPIDVVGAHDVVMRAGGKPAIIAYERLGRRFLEIDLDISANAAFPLTTAFPILIANAVDWLTPEHSRRTEVAPGEPLHWLIRNEQGAPPAVSIVMPGGRAVLLHPAGGRELTFTSTNEPGIYTVRLGDRQLQFVVNPATATESDLMTASAGDTGKNDVSLVPSASSRTDLNAWLLVLALCLLMLDWRYSGARRATTAALVLHCVIAVLLLTAAAGVRFPVGRRGATVVFTVDQSRSIGINTRRRAIARINQMIARMQSRDRAAVVVFGSDSAVERRMAPAAPLGEITSRVDDTGTNIESALRLSRALLPPDGMRRVVLVTDGRETAGEAVREAARAAADDVPLDVVPMQASHRDLAPIVARSVNAPDNVRVGEPFLISAEFGGTAGSTGRATLLRDGVATSGRDIEIGSDGSGTATWQEPQPVAGVHVFEAAVTGHDGMEDGPRPGATVSVAGETRLLYVADDPGAVSNALDGAGWRTTHVAPSDVSPSAGALAEYDAVVLDNVPGDELKPGEASALARYVDEGGGLLVLGSAQALHSTAYLEGPLSAVLPVDLRPRTGRRAPPVAFVLVFDKSGSMADSEGGVQKIELARQAVMKLLSVVPPGDPLGVIAFDAAPTLVAPLAVGHDAAVIAERLRNIEPRGSTAIAPAMKTALDWLRTVDVQHRHVLLVSDGRTSPADAERLRAAIEGQPVELSVVAIGPDAARAFLARLAENTGGRAFFPDDVRELPDIVAREATRSSGGMSVDETFKVRAADHAVVAGISRTSLPRLRGYLVTASKNGAETVLTSHLEDPVLEVWHYGLGSVGIFTSDMRSPWAAGMVRWTGFRQLWRQTLRWLTRRTTSGALRATLLDTRDGPHLVVEARQPDGGFASSLEVRGTIRTPAGDTQAVVLRPTAPGRYEATIPPSGAGPYIATVTARNRQAGADDRVLQGLYWAADREPTGEGADMAALARLARSTGGEELSETGDPFGHPRPLDRRDLSAWLSAAALVLFLVDIGRRRGVRFPSLLKAVTRPQAFSFAAWRG